MTNSTSSGGNLLLKVGKAVLFLGVLVLVLYIMRPLYVALSISFFLAYVTSPIVDYFEGLGIARTLTIIVMFLFFFILLGLFLIYVVSIVSSELQDLVTSLPDMGRRLDS